MMIQNIESKLNSCAHPSDTVSSCYKQAIKLLAHKDYSRHKLRVKLLEKGFSESLVSELIQLLVQEKYLREDYYKEARIKGLLHKGYHPRFIVQKMAQEQCPVTDHDIGAILTEYQLDPDLILQDLIEKKARLMTDSSSTNQTKKWDKIIRFVASKGHCPNKARDILKEFEH